MKIAAIETFCVRIPLRPECRMISNLGRHDESKFLLVKLTTDEGLTGVGEASLTPRWSGETVWGAAALVQRVLTPVLLGCDPHDIVEMDRRMDAVANHNWFAKSAIEMACWDICGKAANKPVYELLGGACRPLELRGRFSIGAYPPERAGERAAELAGLGFDTLKVKVGGDPATDIARVRAVRSAIGPDRALVIDANCGWDVETAIYCVKELADCNLALVEQPTPDGDYAAMARLRKETGAKVMADDICFNFIHAQELIRNECCDVISLYPGKNGGIRKAKAIAEYAAQHGVACSIGSNLEFDIATAAMGHFVVATPNVQIETYPGDIYGPAYYEFRIVREPLSIVGPITTLTERPGLGVDVDWDIVRQHLC
jgi:L-Ala-D/L-Glu epimerase